MSVVPRPEQDLRTQWPFMPLLRLPQPDGVGIRISQSRVTLAPIGASG